jgi:hypothetical protein
MVGRTGEEFSSTSAGTEQGRDDLQLTVDVPQDGKSAWPKKRAIARVLPDHSGAGVPILKRIRSQSRPPYEFQSRQDTGNVLILVSFWLRRSLAYRDRIFGELRNHNTGGNARSAIYTTAAMPAPDIIPGIFIAVHRRPRRCTKEFACIGKPTSDIESIVLPSPARLGSPEVGKWIRPELGPHKRRKTPNRSGFPINDDRDWTMMKGVLKLKLMGYEGAPPGNDLEGGGGQYA